MTTTRREGYGQVIHESEITSTALAVEPEFVEGGPAAMSHPNDFVSSAECPTCRPDIMRVVEDLLNDLSSRRP